MTETIKEANERHWQERSNRLYQAALGETRDPDLKLALLTQSERIAHKALALQLVRKQLMLVALGVPLRV